MTVLPNPFSEQLRITLREEVDNPVFRMYTQLGVLVNTQSLTAGMTTLETSASPPGIYFWELLDSGKRISSGKVLKFGE